MTEKKYNKSNGKFEENTALDVEETAEAIYNALGERFPLKWENETVIYNTEDLPDTISETELQNAIKTVI